MHTLLQDLRYAVRMLAKDPGFTAVAVLTLALGIGANTAVFTLVNAVLLRDLPYPEADRLVRIFHAYPGIGLPRATVSPAGFLEYVSNVKSYTHFAASSGYRAPQNLTGAGLPERVRCVKASAAFFPALGIAPELGRTFSADEEQPGKNRVAVLSHALWRQRFAGDAGIVGKTIRLDAANYTVIGVMPAGFQAPPNTDLWVPIAFTPADAGEFTEYLDVVGRLRRGVTPQQAQAELDSLSQEIRHKYAKLFEGDTSGWHIVLHPLREITVGEIRPALLVLWGAVGFVLLIACANLMNLLLARCAVRQKEIAVRVALGAGRFRLMRQLLTESVVLSLAGGGVGILLAFWGLDGVLRLVPVDLPSFAVVQVDTRALLYTAGLSILTGFLFGLLPAFVATRFSVGQALKEGGQTTGRAAGRHRLLATLVTAEVTLSLVLLAGAGLMLRSFTRLLRSSPGFVPQSVLTMNVALPEAKYGTNAQMVSFYTRVLERLGNLPGVASAAAGSSLPLLSNSTASFQIQGKPWSPSPHAFTDTVSPDYFRALAIPLLRGRAFEPRDTHGSSLVALVDEIAAEMYWHGENPLGQHVSFQGSPDQPMWLEIVGVVGSVRHGSALAPVRKGHLYLPQAQTPTRWAALVVRTSGDPALLASAVRQEVLAVDSEQPTFDIKTMQAVLSESVSQPRFNMVLLSIFGGLSLVLAAAGIYGVISYSVSQRTREIGIRMALGAQPRDVRALVVRQGLRLVLIGSVLGTAAALAATRLISNLLFGTRPTDPVTYVGVTLLLGAVAWFACWVPARRAARVDPTVALRYE